MLARAAAGIGEPQPSGRMHMDPALAWPLMLAFSGAVIGSFIGLLSVRMPAGAKIALDRSRCSGCSRTLGVSDLVPLASYLLLRGRCRTCRSPIGRRYPVLEAASAGIGAIAGLVFPDEQALAAALLGWWLLVLSVLDLEHFWLPDRLTLPLMGLGLLAAHALGWPTLNDSIIGAAAGYLILAAIAAAYRAYRGRDGLGGGDAKLFAAAGSWLGWQPLPTVLLAAACAGLIAALLLHWRRADLMAQRLPLGTFLAPSIWIAYLWAAR